MPRKKTDATSKPKKTKEKTQEIELLNNEQTDDITVQQENSVDDVSAQDTPKIEDNNHDEYCLQSEMSLDEVQDFVDDISSKLSENALVVINLEKTSTINTPLIQAIISLNRYAEDLEKKIQWKNPTNEFSDAFNNLGFYSEMMKLEFAA